MRTKRRLVSGTIVAAVAALALAACGGDSGSTATTDTTGQAGTTSDSATTPDSGTTAESSEPAPPAEPTEIQIMTFPGVAYRLPMLVAEENGWFEEEGVTLVHIAQPNNLPGIQGLLSTGSHVGQFATGTIAQAQQAGEDVKFFCGLINEIQSSLVAPGDTDLPSMADGATWEEVLQALAGKNVGVQTPVGSGLQLTFQAALESVGVTDAVYVNVGGSNATTGPALDNGDVVAAIASPPGTQYLVAEGKKVLAYLPEGPAQYKDWFGSAWGAPTEWLDANPEAAAGFCRAIQRGIDFVQDSANATVAEEMLVSDTGIEPAIATEVVATQFEAYSTALPEDRITTTLTGFVDAGILTAEPAVTFATLVDDKSGQ